MLTQLKSSPKYFYISLYIHTHIIRTVIMHTLMLFIALLVPLHAITRCTYNNKCFCLQGVVSCVGKRLRTLPSFTKQEKKQTTLIDVKDNVITTLKEFNIREWPVLNRLDIRNNPLNCSYATHAIILSDCVRTTTETAANMSTPQNVTTGYRSTTRRWTIGTRTRTSTRRVTSIPIPTTRSQTRTRSQTTPTSTSQPTRSRSQPISSTERLPPLPIIVTESAVNITGFTNITALPPTTQPVVNTVYVIIISLLALIIIIIVGVLFAILCHCYTALKCCLVCLRPCRKKRIYTGPQFTLDTLTTSETDFTVETLTHRKNE